HSSARSAANQRHAQTTPALRLMTPRDARFAGFRSQTSRAHPGCGFRAVTTEIGFGNGWIAPYLRGGAFGDLAAEIQHMDAVGDIHHDPHLVFDHQYGNAEIVADIEHKAG